MRGVWITGHGDMDKLEEICQAQTTFLEKKHVGKIVLEI